MQSVVTLFGDSVTRDASRMSLQGSSASAITLSLGIRDFKVMTIPVCMGSARQELQSNRLDNRASSNSK